ncbi:MAG: transketolase family protein [Candidatus Kaiserbacteria bacterium]|nr:transketolase family protein [Candidatus Kaiserbacteria bacterium]MCB9816261.1 transketolase family protein [Candidatus Nomurabacteria bacterium]
MFADHLQPNLSNGEVERTPTRHGYGEGLLEAGKRDERVVALCCDLTESTQTHHFANAFPNRFVQVGIAEQSMASVASGMAAMGKIPFIASYAMFSPGRSWEQIRTTICYNNSNVKVVGAHAGVSVGPDGATHQAIEDMAIMRVIPNMVVIAPADVHEARKATLAAAKYDGPVYFRLGRSATPVVTTPESPFEIGKAERMYSRDEAHEQKVGIVVTGSLLYNAIMAAKELNENGIGASVLHMATIKPLDGDVLVEFAAEHGALVTVEEHQITGGLGSAVAEHLAECCPTKLARVGVKDRFGESGEPDELISHFGMDVPAIVEAAKRILS